MPRGKSKPKAKAKAAPAKKSARPKGAAKQGNRNTLGQFTVGHILSRRVKVHPDESFQDAQRRHTYSADRLAKAWALVELHIEDGNLDAAVFAIRMACGREPQAVAMTTEGVSPIVIQLPDGMEPPPWMTAPKKVPNLAEQGGTNGQRDR